MSGMRSDSMRERFHAVVPDLLQTDPDTVVVLAAIGASRFPADVRAEFRDRIVDVGIREQAMIGVAGGLALEGLKPIVMSYTPFLIERPFEQIKISLTHQGVSATLVSIGASWDASTAGRTHQAPEDVALMSTLPGWTIHVPGSADEAEAALRIAHADSRSHYIRLADDVNASGSERASGQITTLRRGSDHAPTVLAVGPIADAVIEAIGEADVTVLYTTVPSPMDKRGLRAATLGADLVVVEPYLEGTSTHEVSMAFDRPMRIRSIGVTESELEQYGTRAQLQAAHGLDATGIRKRLDQLLALQPA